MNENLSKNPHLAALLVAMLATTSALAEPPPAYLSAAVANPDRNAADRARDENRNPAEVLAFFGIEPGMTVVDLMAGRGYYSDLLCRAVGDTGKVFVHNNRFVLERFAEKAVAELVAKPEFAHCKRLDRELDNLGLGDGTLDAAVMVLFYHDTYWQKTDRTKMNAGILRALKPGGVFGVVDHHAEPGSKDRDVSTLHRVEATIVKREIIDAGFVLEAESELLRHPDDDRTLNVFKPEIRGKTDRFIYRFRKPTE